MNVIVFVNRIITPDFDTKLIGHVGWGFQLQNGNFMFGSKEATPKEFEGHFPPGTIPEGKPNGVFIQEHPLEQMLSAIKAGGNPQGPRFFYHQYKLLTAQNPNISDAIRVAQDSKNRGYGVAGNNCMDDVYKIITAYAGGDKNFLPWPSTHWLPNHFFDDINAPVQILNAH